MAISTPVASRHSFAFCTMALPSTLLPPVASGQIRFPLPQRRGGLVKVSRGLGAMCVDLTRRPAVWACMSTVGHNAIER